MQDEPGGRRVHRPRQVMNLLGIGPTTFWKLVREQKLDTRKIYAATAVTGESLEKFIAELPKA